MNRHGLSLIEVLVAMVFLAIVGTAISFGMINNMQVNNQSQKNAMANRVAQSLLERYQAHWRDRNRYAAAQTPITSDLASQLPNGFTLTVDANGRFNPDGSASTASNPPIRRVVVTVMEGSRQRAQLETRIGRPE